MKLLAHILCLDKGENREVRMKPFESKTYFILNGAGWELELGCSWHTDQLDTNRRPVLMIPGLGNNKSVFSFPDSQRSWESYLVRDRVEVWTVNLRGQGSSRYLGRSRPAIGIHDMAADLRLILEFILHNTATSQTQVDVIGASLGAAVMYAHAVLQQQNFPLGILQQQSSANAQLTHVLSDVPSHRSLSNNQMGSLVAVGGPFRWEQCHPVVSLVMSQPRLVGLVPVKGSRVFLRHAFPWLRKFPQFIRHYIQPEAIAGDGPEALLLAVDDPNRHLSQQIAEWIRNKDLVVQGINVTQGMKHVTNPLLCATGNHDGIVPPATSLAAIAASGATVKEVLWIGDDATPFGHTDPMIHRESPQRVFAPIAQWLKQQHTQPLASR